MPTNNTENIYSTPFNEGEAQPIPATRIGYDNTDSGMTATDVQSAIDEIAGNISDLSLDGYAIKEFSSVEITPDNDTYGTALDKIAVAIDNVRSQLNDDEMLIPCNLVITSVTTLMCRNQPFYNTDTSVNDVATNIAASSTSLVLYSAVLYSGTGNSFISKGVINASGASFTELTGNSLTEANKLRMSYYIYKKIKAED